MQYDKVHMYTEFVKTLIIKDLTIDLYAQGELVAFMREVSKVVEELLKVGFLQGDEDVYSLIAYLETCSEYEHTILNLRNDIEGLSKEIERLKELNNNQAKMILK